LALAKIQGFEDLIAWQMARALSRAVHAATRETRFQADRDLVSQLRRAAVSVVSNIAEGFERSGRAESAQFLAIAKGSCGEVRAQLYVALDEGYLTESEFGSLNSQAAEAGRVIAGLRQAVQARTVRKGVRGA
jgi:four helix bundle protein